jgi:hypothetical protein
VAKVKKKNFLGRTTHGYDVVVEDTKERKRKESEQKKLFVFAFTPFGNFSSSTC